MRLAVLLANVKETREGATEALQLGVKSTRHRRGSSGNGRPRREENIVPASRPHWPNRCRQVSGNRKRKTRLRRRHVAKELMGRTSRVGPGGANAAGTSSRAGLPESKATVLVVPAMVRSAPNTGSVSQRLYRQGN